MGSEAVRDVERGAETPELPRGVVWEPRAPCILVGVVGAGCSACSARFARVDERAGVLDECGTVNDRLGAARAVSSPWSGGADWVP